MGNCLTSDWSENTTCSKSCGSAGVTKQYRMVITEASGAGTPCGDLVKEEPCDEGVVCPVDCEMNAWPDPSVGECDKTCVTGANDVSTRTQTRTVKTASVAGGDSCPTGVTNEVGAVETRSIKCYKPPCPVDCKVTGWGAPSQCTAECHKCKTWNDNSCTEWFPKGVQFQHRTIENVAFYGGKACPALVSDAQECNTEPCAVDCAVSPWSEWGSCSESCAGKAAGSRLFGAHQERTRFVVRNNADGGRACPDLTQKKLCGLHPCGAHVCTTSVGFPLTCTYEKGIVYTHHVNDVHDDELFMCYHNYVTEVCTCLCWPKTSLTVEQKVRTSSVDNWTPS